MYYSLHFKWQRSRRPRDPAAIFFCIASCRVLPSTAVCLAPGRKKCLQKLWVREGIFMSRVKWEKNSKRTKNKKKGKIWNWSHESIFFFLLKQRSICVTKIMILLLFIYLFIYCSWVCHPVAVVILHVYIIWNWLLLNLSREGYMRSV